MSKRTRTRHRTARRGERGIALAVTLFAIVALLIASTGALMIGARDTEATRNYRGAQEIHFVAESGLTHALQKVNAVGIVNFQNEVVNNWDNWLGTAPRTFPGLTGYSYSVVPVADPAAPSDRGWLVATATGPEGAVNVTSARVQQSNVPAASPGAVYLANDNPTTTDFRGNNFSLNGNDENFDGTAGSGPAVPGIATRNQTNTDEALSELSGSQLDNVTGLGYQLGPPEVASVMTAPSGPSVDQINTIIDSLLALPGVYTSADTSVQGNAILGTVDAPQISHYTGDSLTVRAGGTISGAGILIVDGNLGVLGTLDFAGLVIVRGQTTIGQTQEDGTIVAGTASIYGSLWTNNIDMVVAGSAVVQYSTQGLSLADQAGQGGLLPAPLNVLGLIDCQQVPAGVDGCPA
jgi:hypothetical protein